jgi:hypothetical protein
MMPLTAPAGTTEFTCVELSRDAAFRLALLRRSAAGKSDASMESFMASMQRLLKLDPTDVDARVGAGLTLLEQSRFDDARAVFAKLVADGHSDHIVLFGLANALQLLGEVRTSRVVGALLTNSLPPCTMGFRCSQTQPRNLASSHRVSLAL